MSQPRPPRPAHLELLAVAWNVGWPIAGGVVLGHWLDQKLGSSPAATLVLGLGALIAAARQLVVLGRRDADEARDDGGENGDSPP